MGHNKGISDKPIRLKIFSPHVLCVPSAPPCIAAQASIAVWGIPHGACSGLEEHEMGPARPRGLCAGRGPASGQQ